MAIEKQKLKLETEIQYYPITIYVLSMDSIRIIVPEESFFLLIFLAEHASMNHAELHFNWHRVLKLSQLETRIASGSYVAYQKDMSIFFIINGKSPD